jgi:transglutaminase-like putative cysteine protease
MVNGGRQHYRNGVLTVLSESTGGEPVPDAPKEGELAVARRASPFIQSDHPKILRKAAEIIKPGDTDRVKVRKLLAWVHQHIEKRPVLSVPNALETLENRVGDCNEHAVLMAALARAVGLPAEVEAGLVYLRGRFFFHAWNVIYLGDAGGWMTVDAVLNQMPADVTHIRFIRGQADRQLDLIGLIGNLKLEVLEMKR